MCAFICTYSFKGGYTDNVESHPDIMQFEYILHKLEYILFNFLTSAIQRPGRPSDCANIDRQTTTASVYYLIIQFFKNVWHTFRSGDHLFMTKVWYPLYILLSWLCRNTFCNMAPLMN